MYLHFSILFAFDLKASPILIIRIKYRNRLNSFLTNFPSDFKLFKKKQPSLFH